MVDYYCDDIGNKDRFCDEYKDTVKYIKEQKSWVYYEDGWHYAGIFKLTEPVVRNIYNEAAECQDHTKRKELGDWAKNSQSLSYQRSLLTLATSSSLGVSFDIFDANARVINCKNGIVDLRIKKLIPHSPDQLHLKQANANYNPAAQCPRFMKFLDEIFKDQELIDWLHYALGYSITGLTTEHCFFLCYGNGRNGKGALLETIGYVLGSYGQTSEFDMFLQDKRTSVRELEAVGKLKGRRFVIASETSDSSRLKESLIKRLTGGDKLTGTNLNSDSFEFDPTHTIWLACNHLPAIKDASLAMWERVKVIPFGENFLNEDQEKDLKEVLKTEADGIFNYLVDGAYKYLQTKMLPKNPEVCERAVQEYRDINDKLSIFMRECLVRDNVSNVSVSKVYEKYLEWCPSANEAPISLVYFSEHMFERGVKKKKLPAGMFFLEHRFAVV